MRREQRIQLEQRNNNSGNPSVQYGLQEFTVLVETKVAGKIVTYVVEVRAAREGK